MLRGYDAVGRITSTTNEMGAVTTTAYDDNHRTTPVTDPVGTVSVATRDAAGQVVAKIDGAGATTATSLHNARSIRCRSAGHARSVSTLLSSQAVAW